MHQVHLMCHVSVTPFLIRQGWKDGKINSVSNLPDSLFNQPFKLAHDTLRGVLYIADLNNGALRRAFINGQCRCPPGSLLIASAQSCYNPTRHSGMLIQCPGGQFALEGDIVCRDCSDALAYGLAASACTLWAAQKKRADAYAASGFSYAGVVAQPPSDAEPVAAAKVPAGPGFAVATAVPAGQKWPAGQAYAAPVGAAGVDAGQKKPAVHGLAVPDAWPARQKKPAGHGTCTLLVSTVGQYEPARHAFAVGAVLVPAAERHAPAAQGTHADAPAALIAAVV
jgi:hypothetical protein